MSFLTIQTSIWYLMEAVIYLPFDGLTKKRVRNLMAVIFLVEWAQVTACMAAKSIAQENWSKCRMERH